MGTTTRKGCVDQRRPQDCSTHLSAFLLEQHREKGDDLDRLAETHLVGEQTVVARPPIAQQPTGALDLKVLELATGDVPRLLVRHLECGQVLGLVEDDGLSGRDLGHADVAIPQPAAVRGDEGGVVRRRRVDGRVPGRLLVLQRRPFDVDLVDPPDRRLGIVRIQVVGIVRGDRPALAVRVDAVDDPLRRQDILGHLARRGRLGARAVGIGRISHLALLLAGGRVVLGRRVGARVRVGRRRRLGLVDPLEVVAQLVRARLGLGDVRVRHPDAVAVR